MAARGFWSASLHLLITGTAFLSSIPPTAGEDVQYSGHTEHGRPIYPDVSSSKQPDFLKDDNLAWGDDTFTTANPSLSEVRTDHPRLWAPDYKWKRLSHLVENDAYLKQWNDTIFKNAASFYDMPTVEYTVDGSLDVGSGVLDVAREMQLRVKHWAYAYRVTEDQKWKERIYQELFVASGNSTVYFGERGDNWNSKHWLDVAEFMNGFAIAYDWLYDAWSDEEKTAIMWSLITLGINKGLEAHEQEAWFLSAEGKADGNWNCVTNGGMIVASLAIYHEDPTGSAAKLLQIAYDNSLKHCMKAVDSQGSWSETQDYWYFGVQNHAQAASALQTAVGSAFDMLPMDSNYRLTGGAHIYGQGPVEKFDFGDCGPNKYTATANALLLYGNYFGVPRDVLYQRDQLDAPDPLSMFWYNPEVTGDWFHDLELDKNLDDEKNQWVSMRSNWTNPNALFVAMKSGRLDTHQGHGDLDAGDFVLDALNERWAGELCQDNYLSSGYFSGDTQDDPRWQYYRCGTQGQNTLLFDGANQAFTSDYTTEYNADGDKATWSTDLSAAYPNAGGGVKRTLEMDKANRTVTITDNIANSQVAAQWRMHTNATVEVNDQGNIVVLTINSKQLTLTLLTPTTTDGLTFTTVSATTNNKNSGVTDLPNPGITVLAIDIPAGSHDVAVQFTYEADDEDEVVTDADTKSGGSSSSSSGSSSSANSGSGSGGSGESKQSDNAAMTMRGSMAGLWSVVALVVAAGAGLLL